MTVARRTTSTVTSITKNANTLMARVTSTRTTEATRVFMTRDTRTLIPNQTSTRNLPDLSGSSISGRSTPRGDRQTNRNNTLAVDGKTRHSVV